MVDGGLVEVDVDDGGNDWSMKVIGCARDNKVTLVGSLVEVSWE